MTSSESSELRAPTVRLGDVARRVSYRHTPDPDVPERWIGADQLDEEDLRVRRWNLTDDPMFPPTFKFRFDAGAVLIHSRNPKKVAIADFQAMTGEKLFALGPVDPRILDPRFLALQLQSRSFERFVGRWLAGSVNKFLNWTALERYEFALPPLDEQKRIVEVILLLDEVADAYYSVGRSVSSLLESLSERAWSFKTRAEIGSIGTVITGKTPSTATAAYWTPAEVPFFTPGDFGSGVGYLTASGRAISKKGAEATRLLPKFSVLQTCIGAQFGRVAVTRTEGCCNQQVNALVGLSEADSIFVGHMLASPSGQAALRRVAGTTTLPQVKKSSWVAMSVPWPDCSEREAFADKVEQAARLLKVGLRRQRALADLRRVLLDDFLGGRSVR